MKKNLLFIALSFFAITKISAQSDSAAAMQAWMDYMTPGKMHKLMASWDGKWEGEVSMWMAPNTPAQKTKMKTVNSMIMDGRYQSSTHNGDMMGMPFQGTSTLGYDNQKKMFVSTWVDNMGTGIMLMKGNWNEDTKTITLEGTQTDPMTGKDCAIRETLKIIDQNTQVMEMFGPDPATGKEFKTMEITMKRK